MDARLPCAHRTHYTLEAALEVVDHYKATAADHPTRLRRLGVFKCDCGRGWCVGHLRADLFKARYPRGQS